MPFGQFGHAQHASQAPSQDKNHPPPKPPVINAMAQTLYVVLSAQRKQKTNQAKDACGHFRRILVLLFVSSICALSFCNSGLGLLFPAFAASWARKRPGGDNMIGWSWNKGHPNLCQNSIRSKNAWQVWKKNVLLNSMKLTRISRFWDNPLAGISQSMGKKWYAMIS